MLLEISVEWIYRRANNKENLKITIASEVNEDSLHFTILTSQNVQFRQSTKYLEKKRYSWKLFLIEQITLDKYSVETTCAFSKHLLEPDALWISVRSNALSLCIQTKASEGIGLRTLSK